MCKFNTTIECASRMARNYVISRCGYHVTLKECKAYILDARAIAEKSVEWHDEHGEWPKYRDLNPSWDRAHDTKIFKRKDGVPYCYLVQGVHELQLAHAIA